MVINGLKLASMCDIGNMSVWATKEDMRVTVDVAKKYHCCSVFGLKCWASYMAGLVKGTGINLEFSICNNAGSDDEEVKKFGAKRYVELGLDEVECYLNFSYLKSKMYKEAIADIAGIRSVIPKGMIFKVIIQTPILTDEEICTASKIVMDGGADFVKTGNGEYGLTTVHAVELISKTLNGSGQIKVAMPESIDDIYRFLDIEGVTRFGMSTEGFLAFYQEAEQRYGQIKG
jgi:deoxyribose-phosphate aldolase